VDLVDLRNVSTVLRLQVVMKGEILYEVSEAKRQFFAMQVLSAYALLNEERRGILEDLEKRGSFYGR
jgi:uncharacterized protein